MFLIPWGALSDERTGLSFVCAAGPCQRSLSRALVPWGLSPYFTVSDLRIPFSSPPTTRRVTVEVFQPASTTNSTEPIALLYNPDADRTENDFSIIACSLVAEEMCPQNCSLATVACLHSCYLVRDLHVTIFMFKYGDPSGT
jgi:hypothetical protein